MTQLIIYAPFKLQFPQLIYQPERDQHDVSAAYNKLIDEHILLVTGSDRQLFGSARQKMLLLFIL